MKRGGQAGEPSPLWHTLDARPPQGCSETLPSCPVPLRVVPGAEEEFGCCGVTALD